MKEGYKVTEIGDIPESWELIPLYELRNKADRYSFTGGPFGSDLKSSDYTTSGVRVIQLQNIGEGEFVDKGFIYTSVEKANQLRSCNIYPNEIILAKMAPVARCCKVPDFTEKFVMCSDGIRLSVNKDKFDNEFVYQALNTDYFKKKAELQSTGSTRSRIGLNDLKLIPIAAPKNKIEQQKIASVLSTVDEKIENIDAQISQIRELKRCLMQQLLTKGIGHTKFKSSELGEIPESWELVPLGEVLKLQGGYAFKSNDACEDGIPWLKIANVGVAKVIWNELSFLPTGYEILYKDYCLKKGDIVIAMTRPLLGDNLKIAKITKNDEGALLNQRVGRIVLKPGIYKEFAYQVINSASFIDSLKREIIGSDPPNISSTTFEKLNIALPPIQEQEKVSIILATVDKKFESLQSKKETYQQLKKGLMQQLLIGKIRVNTNEPAFA